MKPVAERKISDQGFMQMNMDSAALKFNRRASGYCTQTNHMLMRGEQARNNRMHNLEGNETTRT